MFTFLCTQIFKRLRAFEVTYRVRFGRSRWFFLYFLPSVFGIVLSVSFSCGDYYLFSVQISIASPRSVFVCIFHYFSLFLSHSCPYIFSLYMSSQLIFLFCLFSFHVPGKPFDTRIAQSSSSKLQDNGHTT